MEQTIQTKAVLELYHQCVREGKIKMWEDPGHGWLQVPLDLVKALQKEKKMKVTAYSYRDRDNAYLEEDCDLSAFANAIGMDIFKIDFQGHQIKHEHKENIFIRNLKHF